MERLAFTSSEALDAYCERLRGDLTVRTVEQRRLLENALQHLDRLAAQAKAVHSDDLVVEIAARREEGQAMLARLTAIEAPKPIAAVLTEPVMVSAAPPAASAAETPLPESVKAITIPEVSQPLPTSPSLDFFPSFGVASEAPSHVAEPPAISQRNEIADAEPELAFGPNAATIMTFAADLPAVATPSEPAFELQPEPEDFASGAPAPVEERAAAFGLSFDGGVAASEPEPAPFVFSGTVPAHVAEGPAPASVSEVAPSKPETAAPTAVNWGWGAGSESPAWAALLVEDSPVPVEPLSDSHFIHAPSPSEIAVEPVHAPLALAPETPTEIPAPLGVDELQQLVLNVKVGEWGSDFPLQAPELVVGRKDVATRCMPDVEVLHDQGVSRRHLRLVRNNGCYLVEDLNSTNGTTLNGHSLRPGRPEKLTLGDELEIGEFTLLRIAAA